jgi:TetR/AcrR family transcriptional repressor of lmrAB and yxaGH operons
METAPNESATRRRMIEAASRLFQACGYRGTSWRQLVRESGTPWGSIQHHFPGGKEELGVAAVEYGTGLLGDFLSSCFENAATPADALRTWFEASAGLLESSGYRFGCPVAAVALDADDSTTRLQQACAKAFESWCAIIERGLVKSGVPEPRARDLAVTILAAFEGALLVSRSRASIEPLRQTGETLCALLFELQSTSRRKTSRRGAATPD